MGIASIRRDRMVLVAIQYLSGESPYDSRSRCPLPSLVLLDTYMPAVGGLEVLEWLAVDWSFVIYRCSCSAASFVLRIAKSPNISQPMAIGPKAPVFMIG